MNGWHLAICGNPAISAPFKAWQYGPVVPSVYHQLRRFGSHPVDEYIKDADANSYVVADSDKQFYEVLDLTWAKYIGIGAMRLSAMTHMPNSPWSIARQHGSATIRNISLDSPDSKPPDLVTPVEARKAEPTIPEPGALEIEERRFYHERASQAQEQGWIGKVLGARAENRFHSDLAALRSYYRRVLARR